MFRYALDDLGRVYALGIEGGRAGQETLAAFESRGEQTPPLAANSSPVSAISGLESNRVHVAPYDMDVRSYSDAFVVENRAQHADNFHQFALCPSHYANILIGTWGLVAELVPSAIQAAAEARPD